jgi:uncharacterized membrane protein YdjX (TVP38/TMEM64 family)
MQKFLVFLNNMDARAWRTVWVSLALLGGVGVILVLGQTGVLGSAEDAQAFLKSLRDSQWALPGAVAGIVVTSFVGFPQFMLAGACVLAFGPLNGSVYALIGAVVASWLHFYIGRFGGAKLVERYGGNMLNRMSRFISRNDFIASAIVRNVPTGPPIIVNMAFGASSAKFWHFIAGAAVGSIPKILVVALLGQSLLSAISGAVGLAIGGVLAVVGTWIAIALMARKAVHEDDENDKDGPGGEGTENRKKDWRA